MKKSVQSEGIKHEYQHVAPEVNVELKPEIKLEPQIQVTAPAPDMSGIVKAIEKLVSNTKPVVIDDNDDDELEEKPDQKIVQCNDKPRQIKVTERDGRGFISKLLCVYNDSEVNVEVERDQRHRIETIHLMENTNG